jgi:hypothetical protein
MPVMLTGIAVLKMFIVVKYGKQLPILALISAKQKFIHFESNVLNHSVEGRNHTVSAMAHVRLFDSDYSFFGKLYGQWDNSWSDDLDMFYGLGYLGWQGKSGFLNPILDCITSPGIITQKNMGKPVAGTVTLLAGPQHTSSMLLMRSLYCRTGMKLNSTEMMHTPNNSMGIPELMVV